MPPEDKKQIPLSAQSPATKAGADVLTRLKNLEGDHNAAVGLSGGVDSSLTAALLVKAGWNVDGITL